MTTLGAKWINEHKVMIYGINLESDSSAVLFKEENWEPEIGCRMSKYIIFESHSVFSEVQLSAEGDIQSHSHAYRSLLRAAIQELDGESSDNKKLVALYELIWSLCEVIFIEHLPGGCVLPYLLELMAWHFPQADKMLSDILTCREPNEHENYWDCIISLLFQGRITEAITLLKASPDANVIIPLLEDMPLLQNFGGHSLTDFKFSWTMWQENCKNMKDNLSFVNEECFDIVNIICGELDAFVKYKSLTHTWYHLMTSYLLYSAPTVTITGLCNYAKDMMDIFQDTLTTLDNILLSIIEFDAHSVITQCISQFENNWWLVAHLADILHHAKQLDSTNLQYGCSLREYVLLQYASELVFNEEFWSIGIDYFMVCEKFGKRHLDIAIPRIPLESQRKAIRLWSVCEKHGLSDLGAGVCRMMSSLARQSNQFGLALIWSLRTKDYTSVTNISDQILDNYIEVGGFFNLDFLDQLGSNKLLSNRLMFLGKYREFHQLIREQQLEEAADLLVSLVESNLGPPRFQITLLLDSLPLMEHNNKSDSNVLDSQKISILLKGLEDIEIKGLATSADKEKLSSIRITLVTNLASALLRGPW